MNEHNPQGRALITGASSGIGATYAERLAQRGYDLILAARDPGRLEAVAQRLRRDTGVAVDVLSADLTAAADLERVVQRLRDDGRISMLVNNAGIAASGPVVGADPRETAAMIALNTLAPTQLALAAASAFAARGEGSIINIASVLALAPELFNGVYGATKAYVLNFSLSLQQELAARGVRVQVVLPGVTRTELWSRSGTDIASLPAEMVMDVDEMVDAALAGFDLGETVTIPSLPDASEWEALTNLRRSLAPRLSLAHAAPRYARVAADLVER
ncbi:SDR family oxidoreductase [Azoarcus sp. DD4]|uniref:SDR family NAD(P)-dependent oxidoreductase n=1 Tax=Azoarcus sp. DD4 TaxID=2027405 RepID=UPI0011292614|nr:SDR family oxidoreductase [Azoarcus sp. DD4]QDF97222.1 SDR family oxidoreductase [Azoarcus sp. DD4]